ncbi:MAG: glutamate--tRNA ligase [Bacillus thermozeamaize]|uniref:Glutamate--tRNA ligase n=1 Tax=Bacillus thermozeamaize TaxID=230954 RepID=A0A1Y3PPY1_9BACI|nr:MAG: glutamate--tRNA ligase [Bacillus thermozeamaize]
MKKVRVRYAPSPTGHLHIGGARTALFNWLFARNRGGAFIIRFEDTDQERNVANAEQTQLEGLRWLGIDWDESVDIGGPYGPYRSMERLHLYRPYVQQLLDEGKAYPCYCTEEELQAVREQQQAAGEMPRYNGRCRHLSDAERRRLEAEGRKPSIRFRVPEDEWILIRDEVRGEVRFHTNDIGDFVIVRPDGIPVYNLAVVIDDHLMEITHVIRGEEHLSNTPRQVLIYQALGWEVPAFAHVSLIFNERRQKMSKRDETIIQFIEQYRELGYLPEAILNFLVLLGWAPEGEEEIFSKEELIRQFSLSRVSKSPAVFDTQKLAWMNNQYLKRADLERVVSLAVPHLEKAGRLPKQRTPEQEQWVRALVGLYQEQMHYAAEIVSLSGMFFEETVQYTPEALEVLEGEQVPAVLSAFLQKVKAASRLEAETVKQWLKEVQKETGFKGKQLFMPIRAAVTGLTQGPDLPVTIQLLGKERVAARLQQILDSQTANAGK